MTNPISNLSPVLPVQPLSDPKSSQLSAGFGSFLSDAIRKVESSGAAAAQAVEGFLGGTGELHQVALANQKSALEFEMFLQVRNKVVQAYQEIMRMQV